LGARVKGDIQQGGYTVKSQHGEQDGAQEIVYGRIYGPGAGALVIKGGIRCPIQ
jgi:hypothetical protein